MSADNPILSGPQRTPEAWQFRFKRWLGQGWSEWQTQSFKDEDIPDREWRPLYADLEVVSAAQTTLAAPCPNGWCDTKCTCGQPTSSNAIPAAGVDINLYSCPHCRGSLKDHAADCPAQDRSPAESATVPKEFNDANIRAAREYKARAEVAENALRRILALDGEFDLIDAQKIATAVFPSTTRGEDHDG